MRNRIALALTLAFAACSAPPLSPPPTLASAVPADKAVNVARNATISATFSEPMVASSFGATTFTFSPAVAGTVTTNGATATFKPSAALAYSTKYTATITTAATGQAAGPLLAAHSWSFTTVSTTPGVASTSPAPNAPQVDIRATVSATF